MYELNKSYKKKLYPFKLYKSDIKDLMILLQKYFGVKLEFDNYGIQDINDLDELEKKILKSKDLKINCGLISDEMKYKYYGDIIIKLNEYESTLETNDKNNTELMGIAYLIENFLNSKKKCKIIKGFYYIFIKIISFFLLFSFGISAIFYLIHWMNEYSKIITFFSSLIIYFLVLFKTNLFAYNSIYLYNKDKLGFWKRNKDNIIIVIISVLLTAFATFAITYYFTVLHKTVP
jgi:hypothetical protein